MRLQDLESPCPLVIVDWYKDIEERVDVSESILCLAAYAFPSMSQKQTKFFVCLFI